MKIRVEFFYRDRDDGMYIYFGAIDLNPRPQANRASLISQAFRSVAGKDGFIVKGKGANAETERVPFAACQKLKLIRLD